MRSNKRTTFPRTNASSQSALFITGRPSHPMNINVSRHQHTACYNYILAGDRVIGSYVLLPHPLPSYFFPHPLSLYLSIYLSVCLSIHLSVYLFLRSVYCVRLSASFSLPLFLSLPQPPSLPLSPLSLINIKYQTAKQSDTRYQHKLSLLLQQDFPLIVMHTLSCISSSVSLFSPLLQWESDRRSITFIGVFACSCLPVFRFVYGYFLSRVCVCV